MFSNLQWNASFWSDSTISLNELQKEYLMLKNKTKYLELNTRGRDFILGDIHGCYRQFYSMLTQIKFDYDSDRLISVGDLIDRGPMSDACLDLILEPWFHLVLANHEDMMVRSIEGKNNEQFDNWMVNGGNWYTQKNSEEPLYFKRMSNYIVNHVPYVIVLETPNGRVNVVHAEIWNNAQFEPATDKDIDNWNFNDINEDMMCWGRTIASNKALYAKMNRPGLSTTYCGHTPTDNPYECMQHRFIDTGAVFGAIKNYSERFMTMVDVTNDLVYSLSMMTDKLTKQTINDVFGE